MKVNGALQRGSAILVLTMTTGAMTQQANAQAAEPEDRSLEEIVVTAQRRAEVLEDVPMSISFVSAEDLATSGVTNIHDIGQITSGVQVNWAGAYTQPTIRGVTSLTNGTGAENNVAIYVDGFYEPSNVAINQDLANVESIQVLKGPQGALYGRNATGGAILINTLAPAETTTGSTEVTYARFDDRRIKGYFSSPINDIFSFSVAGYWRESDGWLDFADPATHLPAATLPNGAANPLFPINPDAIPSGKHAAPIEQRTVRTKLQAKLSDDFTATFGYNYSYSDVFNGNLYTTYDHRVPTTGPGPDFPDVAYNYGTKQVAKTNGATVKLEWDTAFGTLTSYSGYSRIENPLTFDFDGSYADITYSDSGFKQYTKQQTLDFAINAVERMDLIVGASYINDDVHSDPDNPSTNFGPNQTVASVARQGVEAESVAAYVDGTYRLTDQLSLSAGARYTDERKRAFYQQVNGAGGVIFPNTTKYLNFHKFTPRASIRYELAPQTNVYASYSKGFRSGYYPLSGAATPALWEALDPETVDAYEIGFKTATGIMRFDIAGYLYDYKDIHVSVTAPDPRCVTPANPQGLGCTLILQFQNAKKAEIYGIDGNVTISPIDNLNIRAGAAWTHARYKDYDDARGTGINPATNTNASGLIQDWSDKEMARAPEFSANLGADYDLQLPFGSLLLGTNLRYSDSYVINNPSLSGGLVTSGALAGTILPGTNQRFRQDSTTMVSASITWSDPNEHFSVGVFGNNLTDEETLATSSGGAFGDYGTQGEPRTYGVRLGYKF